MSSLSLDPIFLLCVFLLLNGKHSLNNSIHFAGLSLLAEKDRVIIVQPVFTVELVLKRQLRYVLGDNNNNNDRDKTTECHILYMCMNILVKVDEGQRSETISLQMEYSAHVLSTKVYDYTVVTTELRCLGYKAEPRH